MNRKILMAITMLIALTVGVFAQQTYSVSGKVMDTTGEPLAGAAVRIQGTNLGASVNAEGKYTITGVTAGKHSVVASYLGYAAKTKSIDLNKNITVDFILSEEAMLLDGGLVVTAQKREQSIKEIPAAITSLGGSFLKETGQSEINELAAYIPGLEVQVQSPNNPGFVIRGITSDDGASNIEPRVSIFQDGVSISKSRGSVIEVYDMERIEVLKGPQGTLFGRGAQIGALHFIQKKPVDYLDAGAILGIGNIGYKHAEAYVNVPIVGNKLMLRTSGILKSRNGYIRNLSGGTLNGKDTKAIRASLAYRMTPRTNFNLTYNYQKDTPPGTSFKSGTYAPKGGDLSPNTFADLEQGTNLGLNRSVWGLTLQGKHHFNDDMSLTSITAYREFNSNEKFDADGTPASALFFGEEAYGKQFSQELRLNFKVGDKFEGFVGANYFRENGWQYVPLQTDERSFLALVSPLAEGVLNPELKKNFDGLAGAVSQMVTAFGMPASMAEGIIAQLGLRDVKFTALPLVDKDGKPSLPATMGDMINFTPLMKAILADPTPNNPILGVLEASGQAQLAGILRAALSNPNLAGALQNPALQLFNAPLSEKHEEYYQNFGRNASFEVFADGTYAITPSFKATAGLRYTFEKIESGYQAGGDGKARLGMIRQAGTNLLFMPTERLTEGRRFHSIVGRLALNYSITPEWETYLSFARGRRPNVIQFISTPKDAMTSTYAPQILHDELVNSYELGVKGLTLNNSLYMDGALYLFKYKHFQTGAIDPATLQSITLDAGNATAYGFETSFKWQATSHIQPFGNYAYIHATFDEKDSKGNKQNYAGNTFRLTPTHTFAVGFDANVAVGQSIVLFIRPVYQYKSKVFFEEDNLDQESQKAFGLLNLRAGMRMPKINLGVNFFANNLLNKKYIIDAGNVGRNFGIPTYIAGAPRMVGVEVTYTLK